jgi:predicted dehydrogenase
MIAACQRAGVKLMVGQSRRYTDAVFRSKELIAAAQLGEIISLSATVYGLMEKAQVSWWKSNQQTGGFLMSLWGPHVIDYFLWVMERAPEKVFAEMRCAHPQLWEGEDEVMAILSFGSTIAQFHLSWNVRMKPPQSDSAKQIWSSKDGRYERLVTGTRGSLFLMDDNDLIINGEVVLHDETHNNFQRQLLEFVTAIHENREPLTSGAQILDVICTTEACLKSAEIGRPVRLEEIR